MCQNIDDNVVDLPCLRISDYMDLTPVDIVGKRCYQFIHAEDVEGIRQSHLDCECTWIHTTHWLVHSLIITGDGSPLKQQFVLNWLMDSVVFPATKIVWFCDVALWDFSLLFDSRRICVVVRLWTPSERHTQHWFCSVTTSAGRSEAEQNSISIPLFVAVTQTARRNNSAAESEVLINVKCIFQRLTAVLYQIMLVCSSFLLLIPIWISLIDKISENGKRDDVLKCLVLSTTQRYSVYGRPLPALASTAAVFLDLNLVKVST